MDANDQYKQGPEPEIGTENQNGPESEVTDGGDTSINVPGVNIGTDVISPGEGGSDDKSDGSTVLPYNPPLSGNALMYQQYLESTQKQEEEKKKKKRKRCKGKMRKNQEKNQEKLLPTAKNRTVCVCVNSASTALSLCHDGVSTHRPVLSAPLGAAVNKD
jgi:hypothetical protein